MQIMIAQEDYERLIEAFGDEPIAEWPDYAAYHRLRDGVQEDVRAHAFADRGRAYNEIREYGKAEKDLDRAAELIDGERFKLRILSNLARVRSRLGDSEGVFDANMRIHEFGRRFASYYRGTISGANYLSEQKEYDQAIEMLESLDPYSGTWSGRVLVAFARTLARADKTEEAEKAYRVLINNEEIPAGRRGIAYLELGNLFAQAGETEKAVETYSAMREGEQFRSDHREQAEKALEDIEKK